MAAGDLNYNPDAIRTIRRHGKEPPQLPIDMSANGGVRKLALCSTSDIEHSPTSGPGEGQQGGGKRPLALLTFGVGPFAP